jgi:hypothetical protein
MQNMISRKYVKQINNNIIIKKYKKLKDWKLSVKELDKYYGFYLINALKILKYISQLHKKLSNSASKLSLLTKPIN